MTTDYTPRTRIPIIPPIQGKSTHEGGPSEPDIYWIVEKWLERHPEIKKRTLNVGMVEGAGVR